MLLAETDTTTSPCVLRLVDKLRLHGDARAGAVLGHEGASGQEGKGGA